MNNLCGGRISKQAKNPDSRHQVHYKIYELVPLRNQT